MRTGMADLGEQAPGRPRFAVAGIPRHNVGNTYL